MARQAGLEPIPHIAVRNYTSRDELSTLIGRLAGEAGVKQILIISGDRANSAGPFNASLEIIESGMLQQHGITHVSIAGHPDGHPVVSADVMHRALVAKVEAAEQSGLTADIVTQFGFDAQSISRWIMKMRDLGIECPVRIGMAGPTNLTTLLKFAQRCGVKASLGGVTKHAGLVKHLFGVSAPFPCSRAGKRKLPGLSRNRRGAFLLVRRRCGDLEMGRACSAGPYHPRGRGLYGRALKPVSCRYN